MTRQFGARQDRAVVVLVAALGAGYALFLDDHHPAMRDVEGQRQSLAVCGMRLAGAHENDVARAKAAGQCEDLRERLWLSEN